MIYSGFSEYLFLGSKINNWTHHAEKQPNFVQTQKGLPIT